jgi:hypothetical protein
VFALSCVLVLANCGAAATSKPAPVNVIVGSGTIGRPVQPGFVGLSIEYPSVFGYGGSSPTTLNPVFEQLIRNLAGGQRPVLRIGGDSADWAWFPTPGVPRPGGIRFTLTSSWFAVARALSAALNPRLILGVNLEADDPRVAATMGNALVKGIGRNYIAGLEPGNEPELYAAFPWYRTPSGRGVPGRPPSWSFADFLNDYATIVRALPAAPVIGPSIGSPKWSTYLGRFLSSQPHTAIVALHRYPLKHCTKSSHVTAADLLSEQSSRGLAGSIARYVALARARSMPLRIDEMNTIACGGVRGLSQSFATSLWAVDALFEMARVGVDGVNFHTTPSSLDELFDFQAPHGAWTGQVHPIYYGLLFFAQAAPPNSQLLRLTADHTTSAVKVWATRATDGTTRVTLINRGASAVTLSLRAPSPGSGATTQQVLTRLRAPSLGASSGITIGGQSFGSQTSTGLLAGTATTETITPAGGTYTISLPATSAATLTIPR